MKRMLAILPFMLLAGCASERIVLLPSPDGQPSALVVRNEQGEQRLDQPFAETVRRSGFNHTKLAKAEQVKQRYALPIAAQPPRGRSFMLFFNEGSDVPLPDSMLALEQVKAEIAARSAAEVVVIGHTDRVGSEEDNDLLSHRRVESVRALLLVVGIAEGDIETAFRGEREPLVPTQDGVSNPINRRVEVSVR